METLFRNIIRLAFWATLLVILAGTAQRMASAGVGCPSGLGCGEAGIGGGQESLQSWSGTLGVAHQALGGAAGLLILLASVLALVVPAGKMAGVRISLGLGLLLASVQAYIGMNLTHWSAIPLVMVGHLVTGFVIVALLNRTLAAFSPKPSPKAPAPVLLWLARISEFVLLVVVFLGGWVSATGAGLACPDFPTCRGVSFPDADYSALIRGLFDPQVDPRVLLAPTALAALHVLHRALGGLLLILLTALSFGVTSNPKVPALSRMGLGLNVLVFLTVATAFALVQRHLPVALGVLHVFISLLALIWVGRIRQGLIGSEGSSPAIEVADVAHPSPVSPGVSEAPAGPVAGRLRSQLGKTRGGLMSFLQGRGAVDRGFMDDLEAQLLMADLGVTATQEIIAHLSDTLERQELSDRETLRARLRAHLRDLILPVSQPLEVPAEVRPYVILVVGVNGVGKTTTIGKLAKRLQQRGLSVMLAAGDTFRAAAVEQLEAWGERNDVPVIAQHTGADSASVIYDALEAAKARKVDVLIADTAGRLHNKSNLMEELSKVKRIMARLDASAPHEVLLVLDGGTGQNAVNQARQFHEAVGLTGLVLTKLDGTAKGGVLFALARQFGIPIRFIGIGEGIDDLRDFDADEFIAALFDEDASATLH
jgi:fused signal recognition particle receptor